MKIAVLGSVLIWGDNRVAWSALFFCDLGTSLRFPLGPWGGIVPVALKPRLPHFLQDIVHLECTPLQDRRGTRGKWLYICWPIDVPQSTPGTLGLSPLCFSLLS